MTRRFLTALVAAVGVATALAAPTIGQTDEEIDQAFLQAVRDKGVSIADDDQALELAHRTCDVLDKGGSTKEALQLIKQTETTWSDQDAVSFGGLAVYAYCQQHLPQ